MLAKTPLNVFVDPVEGQTFLPPSHSCAPVAPPDIPPGGGPGQPPGNSGPPNNTGLPPCLYQYRLITDPVTGNVILPPQGGYVPINVPCQP